MRTAPPMLDRLEIEQYGGTKETVWGAILLFAFFLPRVDATGRTAVRWQSLAAAIGEPHRFLVLALPAAAGLLAVLLGLFAPGRLRGPVLLVAGVAALLLSPASVQGPAAPGLLTTALLLFAGLGGAVAGVLRAPDSPVFRALVALFGLGMLALHGVVLVTVTGGLSELRAGFLVASALSLGLGAGLLGLIGAGKGPLAHRAARISRAALWTAGAGWGLAALTHPASASPLLDAGGMLMTAGIVGIVATGLVDGLLLRSATARQRIDHSMENDSPGFLQRYRPDAIYRSGP